MLHRLTKLERCEQHIADLMSRLADLQSASPPSSGFLSTSEYARFLQQTLASWQDQKRMLLKSGDSFHQ
jgi:hypothetical protein